MADQVLSADAVHLEVTANSRKDAVRICGHYLLEAGAIEPAYIDAMWERELLMSSYVGEGVAIPHGTDASRTYVRHAQLVVVRFATPIDWDGEAVGLAVGIASAGHEHVEVLGALAEALLDGEVRARLFNSKQPREIADLLTKAFG